MREIISLFVGQCGIQISSELIPNIMKDHSINNEGELEEDNESEIGNLNVHFRETSKGRYLPRSILVDSESGPIENLLSKKFSHLFSPDNVFFGNKSTGSNWAKGHYTQCSDMIEDIMDGIRDQVEECDSLQGFQFNWAIGGGTGSGLGSLITEKISQEYPSSIIHTYPVFPSVSVSHKIPEFYNTTLSIQSLVEYSTMCTVIDNDAMFNVCSKNLALKHSSYEDVNSLFSSAFNGVTSSIRYGGQLNTSLRKLATNLVPFPRIHFFTLCHGPAESEKNIPLTQDTEKNLIFELMRFKNSLTNVKINSQVITYCSFLQMRGDVNIKATHNILNQIEKKLNNRFRYKYFPQLCEWIPDNFEISICNRNFSSENPLKKSGTLLSNNNSIKPFFEKYTEQFVKAFRRKAYLHWYITEGMDEMEFTEAESNFNDLISEYYGSQNHYHGGEESYEYYSEDEY